MKQQLRSVCMILGFIVGSVFHSELAFMKPYLPILQNADLLVPQQITD